MSWYLKVLKNYATISGRARRTEFWMFTLIHALILITLNIIAILAGVDALLYVYFAYLLATIIPGIAVTVRRLHDTGRSGWWYLVLFIPFPLVGTIWLLVLTVLDSEGDNQYGPNPKAELVAA